VNCEPRDCPFCAAGNAGLEAATWLEASEALAIYNLAPLVPGHSLVIPRRHAAGLLELSDAEAAALWALARLALAVLMAVYAAEGFDLSLQDGAVAGQTVPHVHLHLVPRRADDALARPHGDWHAALLDSAARPRLSAGEMAAEVARLRVAARQYLFPAG
jgi:bis(5'-adenosyl)-triphosphatase